MGGIGEIDIAFKGILYDFFSEEQSQKVTTTLDVKRGSGKYITAYAPFGYVKIVDFDDVINIISQNVLWSLK